MATKMKRVSIYTKTFILLLFTLSPGDGYSCPYGQNCAFEPAPPGLTPGCARPGFTFCVHPDPYPEKVIRQLIEAGQYDISTLLTDESREEFSLSKKNDYPYDYGPNSLPHVDQISLVNDPYTKNYNTKYNTRYNHDIFSQKTPLQPPLAGDAAPYNINANQSTNYAKFGFHGYSANGYWSPSRNFGDFDKKVRQGNFGLNQNFFDTSNFYPNYDTNDWFRPSSSGVTRYNSNEWWKYVSPSRSDVTIERSVTFPTRTTSRRRRNAELIKESKKRTLSGAEALRIALGLANEDSSAERSRRQALAPGQQELCSVRTEYINPRAALNNKGSWKYVVNMPDSMSQLVRTEICTSTECSGLCSIPSGYTSRCEQKYIQKRLVALQPNGQNLYTDVFWIPSCCQCTISVDSN